MQTTSETLQAYHDRHIQLQAKFERNASGGWLYSRQHPSNRMNPDLPVHILGKDGAFLCGARDGQFTVHPSFPVTATCADCIGRFPKPQQVSSRNEP